MTIGKYKKMIIWVVAILILAVVINFAMQGNFSSKYDGFASCMTEKGVIMYGTDWCPNCQNQKQLFHQKLFSRPKLKSLESEAAALQLFQRSEGL